jgi:hypothetical protein
MNLSGLAGSSKRTLSRMMSSYAAASDCVGLSFQHTLSILCKVAVVQVFYFKRDEFSISRFRAVFVED